MQDEKMNRQNRTKSSGVYRTDNRTNASGKVNFSRTFVPEYLEVRKIRVNTHTHTHTHTFSPPVTRALIYLFSISPQRGATPFCGLTVYYPHPEPEKGVIMTGAYRITILIIESIIMYHLITKL